MSKTTQMTEADARKAAAGERIAEALGLRRARGFDPERWMLGDEYLTKTAVGVYETIQRLAEETRAEVGEADGEGTPDAAKQVGRQP